MFIKYFYLSIFISVAEFWVSSFKKKKNCVQLAPLTGPVEPELWASQTSYALISSYIKALYNKWNYEMIVY